MLTKSSLQAIGMLSGVDRITCRQVEGLFDRLGIPHRIEGSKIYDIFVAPEFAERAVQALRTEATQRYCPVHVLESDRDTTYADYGNLSELEEVVCHPNEHVDTLIRQDSESLPLPIQQAIRVLHADVTEYPFVRTIKRSARGYLDERGAEHIGYEVVLVFSKDDSPDSPSVRVFAQVLEQGEQVHFQGSATA